MAELFVLQNCITLVLFEYWQNSFMPNNMNQEGTGLWPLDGADDHGK